MRRELIKAIAEAKEYLEIVAGSRVRDNSKCLVVLRRA